MRPATPSNVTLKTTMDGEEATVELEAIGGDSGLINFMRTDAKVVRPDGSLAPLSLEQVGPGRYRGKFSTSDTGSYLVDVGLIDANGSRSAGSIQGAVSMAYPREFRTSRDNTALMREIQIRNRLCLNTLRCVNNQKRSFASGNRTRNFV